MKVQVVGGRRGRPRRGLTGGILELLSLGSFPSLLLALALDLGHGTRRQPHKIEQPAQHKKQQHKLAQTNTLTTTA